MILPPRKRPKSTRWQIQTQAGVPRRGLDSVDRDEAIALADDLLQADCDLREGLQNQRAMALATSSGPRYVSPTWSGKTQVFVGHFRVEQRHVGCLARVPRLPEGTKGLHVLVRHRPRSISQGPLGRRRRGPLAITRRARQLTPQSRISVPGQKDAVPCGAASDHQATTASPSTRCSRMPAARSTGRKTRGLGHRLGHRAPTRPIRLLSRPSKPAHLQALLRRARQDSNLRPLAPEASALSTELRARE